jgi:hypothetical protein
VSAVIPCSSRSSMSFLTREQWSTPETPPQAVAPLTVTVTLTHYAPHAQSLRKEQGLCSELSSRDGCAADKGPDDAEEISTMVTWIGLWDAYVLPNITYFDHPEELPELLRQLAQDTRYTLRLSEAMSRFWTTAARIVQVIVTLSIYPVWLSCTYDCVRMYSTLRAVGAHGSVTWVSRSAGEPCCGMITSAVAGQFFLLAVPVRRFGWAIVRRGALKSSLTDAWRVAWRRTYRAVW